jgi:hypothetical protein
VNLRLVWKAIKLFKARSLALNFEPMSQFLFYKFHAAHSKDAEQRTQREGSGGDFFGRARFLIISMSPQLDRLAVKSA